MERGEFLRTWGEAERWRRANPGAPRGLYWLGRRLPATLCMAPATPPALPPQLRGGAALADGRLEPRQLAPPLGPHQHH